jgi:hypothetical protein
MSKNWIEVKIQKYLEFGEFSTHIASFESVGSTVNIICESLVVVIIGSVKVCNNDYDLHH